MEVGGPGQGALLKERAVSEGSGGFGTRTVRVWQSYRGCRGEIERPGGQCHQARAGHVVGFGGLPGATKKAGRERGDGSPPRVPTPPVLGGPSCHTQASPRSASLLPPGGGSSREDQSPGQRGKQEEVRININ